MSDSLQCIKHIWTEYQSQVCTLFFICVEKELQFFPNFPFLKGPILNMFILTTDHMTTLVSLGVDKNSFHVAPLAHFISQTAVPRQAKKTPKQTDD